MTRKHRKALPSIVALLEKNHLSILDALSFAFTRQNEYPGITSDFAVEMPELLKWLSKQNSPAFGQLLKDWCHEEMKKTYQIELELLMDNKDTYQMPSKSITSTQILSFSSESMTKDMEDTAPYLWDLLDKILDSNKRQHYRRANIRKKLQNTAEDLKDKNDAEYASSDDEDELLADEPEHSQKPTNHRGSLTKRQCTYITRFDALTRVKKQAIISICMQHTNSRCNAYQVVNALGFHSCNTPDVVVQSLAHVGLSVSRSSITRMILALSLSQHLMVRDLVRKGILHLAYDNFDMALNTTEPTLLTPGYFWNATNGTNMRIEHAKPEVFRVSNELWKDSALNLYRESDPPTLHWFQLAPQDNSSGPHPHVIQTIAWHLRNVLVNITAFKDKEYHKFLKPLPEKKKIPVCKTLQIPAKAMDIKQSTNDGQAQILEKLLNAAGLGDLGNEQANIIKDLSEDVLLVHGDLSTFERVKAAMRYRAIEQTATRRLQYIIFVPGAFHYLMACADATFRALILPLLSRTAADGLFRHVGILRPRETGKFTSQKGPNFRAMHDVIMEDSKVCFADCWRVELEERFGVASVDEYAERQPTWEELEEISIAMAYKYFAVHTGEGSPDSNNSSVPDESRDFVFENAKKKHALYFYYLELALALNAGDIGRVEDTMFFWITTFQGLGKHKYASLLTRFLLDLRFRYPPGLREAIRLNWLCNPSGRENKFRAIDWLVEINNCETKVTFSGSSSNRTKEMVLKQSNLIEVFRTARRNMYTNYHLLDQTSRHKRPDMTQTRVRLAEHVKLINPNKKSPGRKSRYIIPSFLEEGLLALHKTENYGAQKSARA